MRLAPPLVLALLLASWTATATATARAEEQRAAVVPVQLVGTFGNRVELRHALTLELQKKLRANDVHVLPDDVLAPIDNDCHEQDCLVQILDAYGVQVAVTSRVTKTDDKTYQLQLIVLLHPASDLGAATTVQLRTKTCVSCDERLAGDQLTALLDDVLTTQRAPTPSSTPSPEPVVVAPVVTPPPPPTLDTRRLALRISSAVDGAAAIAMLGIGFWDLAQKPIEVTSSDTPCPTAQCGQHRSYAQGEAIFFTLGGVLAATSATLAALGWWPRPRPSASAWNLTPAVDGKSGQLAFTLRF